MTRPTKICNANASVRGGWGGAGRGSGARRSEVSRRHSATTSAPSPRSASGATAAARSATIARWRASIVADVDAAAFGDDQLQQQLAAQIAEVLDGRRQPPPEFGPTGSGRGEHGAVPASDTRLLSDRPNQATLDELVERAVRERPRQRPHAPQLAAGPQRRRRSRNRASGPPYSTPRHAHSPSRRSRRRRSPDDCVTTGATSMSVAFTDACTRSPRSSCSSSSAAAVISAVSGSSPSITTRTRSPSRSMSTIEPAQVFRALDPGRLASTEQHRVGTDGGQRRAVGGVGDHDAGTARRRQHAVDDLAGHEVHADEIGDVARPGMRGHLGQGARTATTRPASITITRSANACASTGSCVTIRRMPSNVERCWRRSRRTVARVPTSSAASGSSSSNRRGLVASARANATRWA